MKLEYKGYTIIQNNYNKHVCIYKNDELIMHFNATIKLSKEDLKMLVNMFLL